MTTEAETLANILAWSAESPSWQRDALRRLATQTPLGPPEINELIAICKGNNPGIPLDASHLRDPSNDQGEVYLRQIHDVRHVNALAPDQLLNLRRVGLTVIYGDNGSGKSGYARILKKACRARMPPSRTEEIIPVTLLPGFNPNRFGIWPNEEGPEDEEEAVYGRADHFRFEGA